MTLKPKQSDIIFQFHLAEQWNEPLRAHTREQFNLWPEGGESLHMGAVIKANHTSCELYSRSISTSSALHICYSVVPVKETVYSVSFVDCANI